jgi:hypothetical protein
MRPRPRYVKCDGYSPLPSFDIPCINTYPLRRVRPRGAGWYNIVPLSSCLSEDGFASLEWIFPMLLLACQLSTHCIQRGQVHVLQFSFETVCLASSVVIERRDTRVTVQRNPNSFGILCSKVYVSLEHFEIASAAVDSSETSTQTQAICSQTKSPYNTSSTVTTGVARGYLGAWRDDASGLRGCTLCCVALDENRLEYSHSHVWSAEVPLRTLQRDSLLARYTRCYDGTLRLWLHSGGPLLDWFCFLFHHDRRPNLLSRALS